MPAAKPLTVGELIEQLARFDPDAKLRTIPENSRTLVGIYRVEVVGGRVCLLGRPTPRRRTRPL